MCEDTKTRIREKKKRKVKESAKRIKNEIKKFNSNYNKNKLLKRGRQPTKIT